MVLRYHGLIPLICEVRPDWDTQIEDDPTLGLRDIMELSDGSFVADRRDVVLIGGTGTGKTNLAIAIGRALIRTGTRGRFCNVVHLENRLETETRGGKQRRVANCMTCLDFAILDKLGYPALDAGTRLTETDLLLAGRLESDGAVPQDDHVEVVEAAASPVSGRIGFRNSELGLALEIGFDSAALPVTALWRAFQSGTFALGFKPQTTFADEEDAFLPPAAARTYAMTFTLGAG